MRGDRTIFLSFLLVVLVFLVACTDTPSTTPSALTQSSLKPEPGFSIYLAAGRLPPGKLDLQAPFELEKEPLISIEDIVTYGWSSHTIRLTETGYAKIYDLEVPTDGIAFVVCVDQNRVYSGALWAMYSSLSFGGVVIDPYMATPEEPVIQIALGYPGESFFEGEDPRSDDGILQALEEAGKLKKNE